MSASRAVANFGDPQNHKTDHGGRALGSAPRDPNPAGTAGAPGICISQGTWLWVLSKHILGSVSLSSVVITSDWDQPLTNRKTHTPTPTPQQRTHCRAGPLAQGHSALKYTSTPTPSSKLAAHGMPPLTLQGPRTHRIWLVCSSMASTALSTELSSDWI